MISRLLRSLPLVTAFLIASTHLSTLAIDKKPAKKARPKATQPLRADTGVPYASRAEVMALADDLASRRSLDPDWVRRALASARKQPVITRLVLPPPAGTAKNWAAYRSRFIDPVRIQAGSAFWQAHQDTLARAEAQYGVPAAVVVGIIGVETLYGRQTGNFRVIDALATLAFDFPQAHPRAAARQAFFRDELEQFLSLCHRSGMDPLEPRGSYAGAMGLPQFMPSSWVRYATDFDGDGKIDLWNSPADAIGSVAAYFQGFNWITGMPTHYPVRFDDSRLNLDTLLAPDILPSFSVDRFQSLGAVLDGPALSHTGPLALIELQNGTAPPSYVAGTENFYTLTRYNWSSYYAMAVIDLAQAVTEAREAALRGR